MCKISQFLIHFKTDTPIFYKTTDSCPFFMSHSRQLQAVCRFL